MKPTQLIVGDRVKVKPHGAEEFEATFIQRTITTGELRRVGKCRFLGLKSQTYFWLSDAEVYHQVELAASFSEFQLEEVEAILTALGKES